MSVRNVVEKGSLRLLVHGLLAWIVSAFLLCFLTACVIRAHGVGSACYGYISAGLSFLCAVFAGAYSGRGERKLSSGLLCALFLSIVLLTAGFVISRGRLDSSAVLSVVSFSIAGCLLGSLLFGGMPKKQTQSPFRRKKKRNRNS